MSTSTTPRVATTSPEIADTTRSVTRPGRAPSGTPGTATVDDVTAIHDRENRLCELVDGVLVEKVMGFRESRLGLGSRLSSWSHTSKTTTSASSWARMGCSN